ncbi:hypothetical protein [Chlamydia serpentis]|nr:hypothetical protein [Chlamydia serpentis]
MSLGSFIARKVQIFAIILFILGAILLAIGAALAVVGFFRAGIPLCSIGSLILTLGLLLLIKKDTVVKAACLKACNMFLDKLPTELMKSQDNEIETPSNYKPSTVAPVKKEFSTTKSIRKTKAEIIQEAQQIIAISEVEWVASKNELKRSNLKKDIKNSVVQMLNKLLQITSHFKRLIHKDNLSLAEEQVLLSLSKEICRAQPMLEELSVTLNHKHKTRKH